MRSELYSGLRTKYPQFLSDINQTNFIKRFSKNTQISDFTNDVFHVDRRTDGQTWRSKQSLFEILRTRLQTKHTLFIKYAPITHFLVKVKCSRHRPGVVLMVGRGIALLFHDRGTRRWWVVSSTPRPQFTPGKDTVSIVQEAGCPRAGLYERKISSPSGYNPDPPIP